MRKLLHILSALLILVTAQAFASAKAAPDPSGRMVLCVGTTIMVVLTDAEGRPMEAPHLCPDATLLAPAAVETACAAGPDRADFALWAERPAAVTAAPVPQCAARGPPTLI